MPHAARSCFCSVMLLVLAASAVAQEQIPAGYVTGGRPSSFGRTGFYAGPGIGMAYNAGFNDWTGYGFGPGGGALHLGRNPATTTFAGGIIAGYQIPLQALVPSWWAPLVFGPEVDFDYLGELRRHEAIVYNYAGGGAAPAGIYSLAPGRDSSYLGTVRARFGYTFADDKAQMFFSAGFAFAGSSAGRSGNVTYMSPQGAQATFASTGRDSRTGAVFGLGWGYSFHARMDLRLEMLYVDLKTNFHSFNGPGSATAYSIGSQSQGHFTLLRAGYVYHF